MRYPEIHEATRCYWDDVLFSKLKVSNTLKDVFEVALLVIGRMPDDIAQVCGPITNGGKGSVEANLFFLNESIGKIQREGVDVFDQMPFEEIIHRIVNTEGGNQKYENILNDFYEPLFSLGRIKTLYFVPGWESSRGANWEYAKAKELGIEVRFL